MRGPPNEIGRIEAVRVDDLAAAAARLLDRVRIAESLWLGHAGIIEQVAPAVITSARPYAIIDYIVCAAS
jgi:hypothetical protein